MQRKMIDSVILAAGLGKRMKSSYPKVLHRIARKPMVFHLIDTIRSVLTGKLISVINTHMKPLPHTISVIQHEQRGTAHAVNVALSELESDRVLIVPGDVPLVKQETIERLVNESADLVILSFKSDNPFGYGRIIGNAIVEELDTNSEEQQCCICNSGVMIVDMSLLKEFLSCYLAHNYVEKEYYLTKIMSYAYKRNKKISVLSTSESEVHGVNTLVDLSIVESYWQKQYKELLMKSGVLLHHPETICFAHDTIVDSGAEIEGHVVFGENVHVHSSAYVRSFCYLEGCNLFGEVGPFSRVRAGSIIDEGAAVGNFVEIKNTHLRSGAKAKHLSYLGDSDIGEKVTIGAGTITCNYDGFNKHKTIIEKEAFIGSNTTLIAPVMIGEKSIIGAGSLVREDIESETLVRPNFVASYKVGGANRFRDRKIKKK